MFEFILEPHLYVGVFVVLLILVYMCYNLYRKVIIYENWATSIQMKINKLQSDIKDIDAREIFEKDDEVGFIYTDVSKIIKDIDTMVEE